MKNIHVLPTPKPSRFTFIKYYSYYRFREDEFINDDAHQNQHIYITSDEALPYDSSIFDSGAFYHIDPVRDVHIITKHTFKPNPHFCKRIILTTDQDLIKDGVQAIDDEFLEWFSKNPSREYVNFTSHGNEKGTKDYELIIPKEVPNQTDEKGRPMTYWGGLAEHNQEGIYSYDEVRAIAYKAYCIGQLDEPTEGKFNKWIHQFKKK